MASSCLPTSHTFAEPLSAPVLHTARPFDSNFGRRGTVCDSRMPQHINGVVRTSPSTTKKTGSRAANQTQPSTRISLLHCLPPADTISPTTPVEFGFAIHNAIAAINEEHQQTHRTPLSAAALEGIPSPQSPSGKEEHRRRIGAWRRGVAHASLKRDGSSVERKRRERGTERSIWPIPAADSKGSRRVPGPILSVVIPDQRRQAQDNSKTPGKADQGVTTATPAVSKFNMTTHILPTAYDLPAEAVDIPSSLSQEDEHGFPMTAPATMPKAFDNPPPMPKSTSSRSSSTSSSRPSYDDSEVSTHSKQSSKTSLSGHSRSRSARSHRHFRKQSKTSVGTTYTVLDPAKAGVFDDPKANLMKSLPPSPGPGPEMFSPSRSWSMNTPRPKKHDSMASVKYSAPPAFVQRPHTRQNTSIDWKPVLVKASKSCRSLHRLDAFDSEFMLSDPYGSSTPTSPTVSEAFSELNDRLCEIKPLAIKPKSRPDVASARPVLTVNAAISSSDDQIAVPRINVIRTGSDSSASSVPSIPPKSALRQQRRPSFESDSLISPTTLIGPQLSSKIPTGQHAMVVEAKVAIRSESRNNPRNDSITQLAKLRIPRGKTPTPVTAKPASTLVPRLPMLSPVTRLLSPCTPSARISILIPTTLDDENTSSLIPCDEAWQPATPTRFHTARAAAETALLRIMASLSSLEDLSNAAVINKGMRRVYKQNELSLLKAVLKNEASAAWELREWTPPMSPETTAIDTEKTGQQYSAMTYKSHAVRDRAVIASLKPMIVKRCASFLRAETVSALKSKSDPNASRFEQAFYRIWCFCRIFGSGKHREEDITGQVDWLKGGELAHSQGCEATINSNMEFNLSSVLLNPPDHFGICNAGSLSADELFDMTELWNCLTALLQPYVGKTSQARTHGIFGPSKVKSGDVEAEAVVLEEWIFYVLSLGPDAVLKLAEVSSNTNSGFALAAINGWMEWLPPAANTSRGPFLREPVCRLYEEQMTKTPIPSTLTPKDRQRKELSRKRVANLAAEIRAAKCESGYKRLPVIDMAAERPMSTFSRQSGQSRRTSIASSVTLVAPAPATRGSEKVTTPLTAVQASPPVSAVSGSTYSRASAGTATGTWFSRGKISPISGRDSPRRSKLAPPRVPPAPEPMMGRAREASDAHAWADSTGFAIQNVVAMGFTPGQAREALKVTDSGDGLHVDRAVDWLLRHSP